MSITTGAGLKGAPHITVMRIALGAIAALGLSGPAPAASMYHVTDLGVLPTGAQFSRANGLNDRNQVVGISGNSQAFIWENGIMTGLGGLPGGTGFSLATGINNAGQVVGRSSHSSGYNHAFLWQQGVGMTDLGLLPGGTDHSGATAINNAGTVVGDSHGGNPGNFPSNKAFSRQSGFGMTDLAAGLPVGTTLEIAQGISSSGHIVGRGHEPNLPSRGFLLDTNGALTFLNSTSGLSSWAYGINDSGDVVGQMYDSVGPHRAALWRSGGYGSPIELGGLLLTGLSQGLDINNASQVVGWSYIDAFGNTAAFLWLEGEGMLNLNHLLVDPTGWNLQQATAINESGVIVGFGLHNNVTRGFILTPVPEPHEYALMLAGLGIVALVARCRKPAGGSSRSHRTSKTARPQLFHRRAQTPTSFGVSNVMAQRDGHAGGMHRAKLRASRLR